MRSNSAVLLILISLAIVTPILAQEPSDPFSRIEAMRAASADNEHERVVEIASGIVAANPDRAEAWYLLGRHAEPLDRPELVISASSRAWELGYQYMPWIAVRIARAAASLDEKERAFEWLRKALDAGLEDRQSIARMSAFEKYLDDPEFRTLAAMPHERDTRTEGLRRDIDLLVEEAQRLHADPDRPAFNPRFLDAASELKNRAGALNDGEVLLAIRHLTTLLGDGHTVAYGALEDSPLEIPASRLPIKVYLFQEGLYVIDSYDEKAAGLVGKRIVAIGRKSPEQLLEASREMHGSDNPMTMLWLAPQFYFPSTEFLLSAGAIEDPSRVKLTVEDAEGKSFEVDLETGDYPIVRKLHASAAIEGDVPLYLQNVETSYWMKSLPDHSALYFQFNQVRNDESESIEDLAARLGAALSGKDVKDLIVDVRHNNGGNNGLLRPLVRQIVAFDVRPGTRIFVITGRNTFSAAQNFINRLERWTDAIFVGEPSSSSPNFTGEETELVLPWSRIAVSISSRHWQDSDPGDERSWIAPHVPIAPTAADYFAGRDAALEAILAMIG